MDFAAIKEAVSLERAAEFLGIELKRDGEKYRCHCPQCDKPRVLILTPAKRAFYCHAEKTGGDVIGLVAHVKGIKQSEAAKFLEQAAIHWDRKNPEVKPKRRRSAKPKPGAGGTEMEMWETFISRL